jgi:deferrochelatase/peroxidase EfeB
VVRRRSLLAAVAAAAGTTGGVLGCERAAPPSTSDSAAPVAHQPGVLDPPPAASVLAAYDVTAADRAGLAAALRTLGRPAPGVAVTVAMGASLFDGRFGLAKPRLLAPMPEFPGDVPDPAWCHGDLLVQLTAADPAVARSALPEDVPGLRPRWRLDGFHPRELGDGTRNMFGFREGSGNPDTADRALMDQLVWVQPGDGEPAWCVGGTYLVVRLIRLAMSSWNREPLAEQEKVFGRHKDSSAPLGQSREEAEPDFAADPDGRTIALNAHIRRANPRTPHAQAHRILRRGWSYRLPDDVAGEHVGQIFTCYQRDVEKGFATIQRRLTGEALERYLLPHGGGYYFVPPAGVDQVVERVVE